MENNQNNDPSGCGAMRRTTRSQKGKNIIKARKANKLAKKNFNQMSTQNDRYSGAVTRIGRGELASILYDPSADKLPFMAKIPLSCRVVARLNREFEIFQEYCPIELDIDITSGFPQTSGGNYRYGLVMDALDSVDETYDSIKQAIAASPVNGTCRFVGNKNIKIRSEVFRNTRDGGWRYTTAGANPRLSEIGYLYIVALSDPSAANVLTVDVRATIKFRQPSVESSRSNGFFTTGMFAHHGWNYILPKRLMLQESVTTEDIRTEYPGLPIGVAVLKLNRAALLTYKVGAGDVTANKIDHLLWTPDAASHKYFCPIRIGKTGVYEIDSETFDHADADYNFKLALEDGTSFEVIGESVSDLNASVFGHLGKIVRQIDAHGNSIARFVLNKPIKAEPCKLRPVNHSGVIVQNHDLDRLERSSDRRSQIQPYGPYPPNEETVLIDEDQYLPLVELGTDNGEKVGELSTKVSVEHAQTRSRVTNGFAASDATILGEIAAVGERNRIHVTTQNTAVQVAVLAETTVIQGVVDSIKSTVNIINTNVNNLSVTTNDNKQMLITFGDVQEKDSARLVQVHELCNTVYQTTNTIKDAVSNILNVLGLQHDEVIGRFNAIDRSHADILNAVRSIHSVDAKPLLESLLVSMKQSYDTAKVKEFRTQLNSLLAAFEIAPVSLTEFSVIIEHTEMKRLLTIGHLFPYVGSDVPMENVQDYIWPDFHSAAPEELVGLYFRTQQANVVEDYPVYTYFRIDSTNDNKMFCSRHNAGDPALPRN